MGRAELYREQVAALVCREYGWTWQEFSDQPHWFIEIVLSLLRNETENQNRQAK